MGSTSLHPSGTRGPRTDPTLTSAVKDRAPGAVSFHTHRALALFIGGAGDKKSYYLAGPYHNIAYALDAFDQRIEEVGQVDGYQSLYLGYHEVWSASAIGRLVAAEAHDKNTPIYIVGHSLSTWSGAHFSGFLAGDGVAHLPHLPRSPLDALDSPHPGFITRQMAAGSRPDARAHRRSAECPRRCAVPRPG